MILPPELAKKACLIVMGVKGAKNNSLKTDQDNALIIDDGMDESLYVPYMQRFTETLIDFGFPAVKVTSWFQTLIGASIGVLIIKRL